jgi:hypothetical protein
MIVSIFINKNIMKKIIRLTESDLTRIVRRVINEQGDTLDLQLISCLKNKGYKSVDTGGKYRYMLQKEKNLSSTVTLILTISSQDNKNKASLVITNYNSKVLYSGTIDVTPELLKNCQFYQQVEVSYNEALKKNETKKDPTFSSDPELTKELLGKGFVKTEKSNIFKKDGAYVSIFNTSVGSVCFNKNFPAGTYTEGSNNIQNAITKAKEFKNNGVTYEGKKLACERKY